MAQPLWAPLVAQHLLNQKFAEINQYLEQRSLALDSMITQQVQSLTFTCNSHDQQLIRDPQFYNRFVRLIGIENAQGDGCSTVGYPIALAADSSASEPMGFTLSATPVTQTASRELLIQYSEPGGRVFWVVDGSWAQELLREPCSDCFYLQFKFLDPMLSELAIQRGNIAILGESIRFLFASIRVTLLSIVNKLCLLVRLYSLLHGNRFSLGGSSRSTAWRVSLSKLFDFT